MSDKPHRVTPGVCPICERDVRIAALEAEVAAKTKDAERWRYWRDNHGWTGYFDDDATNSEDNAEVDAACDAAIARQEQTK